MNPNNPNRYRSNTPGNHNKAQRLFQFSGDGAAFAGGAGAGIVKKTRVIE